MDGITVAWILVIIAGIFEPIWVYFLEKSEFFKNAKYSVLTIVFLFLSLFLMSIAMRDLGPGTTYAVWTGIGVIGAVAIGAAFMKEPITVMKLFFVVLIVVGIVGINITGAGA